MSKFEMKTIVVALFMGTLGLAPVKAADVAVKTGEKIAFLGDSITQAGSQPGGYVMLVMSGLEANGIKATAIPAGIGGHNSNQMLARLEKDILVKKPDWMTLSCGVNDVWYGAKGVSLEQYKENITKIIDQCQSADIKVMILTTTMIGEDATAEKNQKLAPYNAFLVELAKEKKCLLADLNAAMQTELAAAVADRKDKMLTKDGVHMNADGNRMMAVGVLKAFGLDEKQIAKARENWAAPVK